MRFNSVGFALSVGMALIVVLFGFTLLSAAGLAGFAAGDTSATEVSMDAGSGANDSTLAPLPRSVASLTPEAAAVVNAGDALFKNNCAQCHAVNEKVVGPALAGISKRRPISWLIPWVKNSSKMVASGDEYAVKIYNEYQKQQMPSFALSDEEITFIIAYIEFPLADYAPVAVR